MDLSLMLVVIGVMTCPFAKHPCGAPKGDGILLSAFLPPPPTAPPPNPTIEIWNPHAGFGLSYLGEAGGGEFERRCG